MTVSMFTLSVAVGLVSLQSVGSPTSPVPVECVYSGSEPSLMAQIWSRMQEGIPNEDPLAASWDQVTVACATRYGWGRMQAAASAFYALLRHRAENLARELVNEEADRIELQQSIHQFYRSNRHLIVDAQRTGGIEHPDSEDHPAMTRLRTEFASHISQAHPDLLRRIGAQAAWSIAWPAMFAEDFQTLFPTLTPASH